MNYFESITTSSESNFSSISNDIYSGEDEINAQNILSDLESTDSDSIEIIDPDILQLLNQDLSSVPVNNLNSSTVEIPLQVIQNNQNDSNTKDKIQDELQDSKLMTKKELKFCCYPYTHTFDEEMDSNSTILFVQILDLNFPECSKYFLQPMFGFRIHKEKIYFVSQSFHWEFEKYPLFYSSDKQDKIEYYISTNKSQNFTILIEFSIFPKSIPIASNLNITATGFLKMFPESFQNLNTLNYILIKQFRIVSSLQKDSLMLDYHLTNKS